ncbi:MAG TPA: NUDIX domain-containing protein [Azospirillaceae bacterium]|nr:NUDIX domain-containing protein [Azospirillaceae bacterium]
MTGGTGPRVGCGAAILDGNRLLLVKRLRDPEAGHWGLPGGKVDWMEPVPAAVCREIEEELGIRITLDRLLCVADHIDPARGDHWVAPVYLAHVVEGTPVVREPQALAAAGWFPLDGLPDPLTLATRIAIEALA